VASAPITRGAAAPHRVWRDARAAETSGERLAIGRPVSNICSISSTMKFVDTLALRPLDPSTAGGTSCPTPSRLAGAPWSTAPA
jgi:hypothetical protein